MDVVKTNVELIGGAIDLKSRQGAGTTFIIKIPLTLHHFHVDRGRR